MEAKILLPGTGYSEKSSVLEKFTYFPPHRVILRNPRSWTRAVRNGLTTVLFVYCTVYCILYAVYELLLLRKQVIRPFFLTCEAYCTFLKNDFSFFCMWCVVQYRTVCSIVLDYVFSKIQSLYFLTSSLLTCDLWLVACGLWLVACGLWLVACGLWLVACGLWLVACGLWRIRIHKVSSDCLLFYGNFTIIILSFRKQFSFLVLCYIIWMRTGRKRRRSSR